MILLYCCIVCFIAIISVVILYFVYGAITYIDFHIILYLVSL